MMTGATIHLRAPNSNNVTDTGENASQTFVPPPITWVEGTWHVTHSTLPMWRKNRNVKITYTQLPLNTSGQICLDDKVEYQSLKSEKLKTVAGIDTPAPGTAWNWRGKGWLKIASSHWQILGYGGVQEETNATQPSSFESEEWVVTYFAKTLFTPAGIDIYSRRKEGLKAETLDEVKKALANVDAADVKRMAGELFEVQIN